MAGLLVAFCAGFAGAAHALEEEPAGGGLLSTPGTEAQAPAPEPPPPATAPAATSSVDDTSWGLLVRGGSFGVPNAIADELFTQHPDVTGTNFGAEIRYHGEGGGRGAASLGLAVDFASADGAGTWQQDEEDTPQQVSGEIEMLSFSLTGYWNLFPSWPVHPYFGIGIGVAHATGHYQDESEKVTADYWVPVVHVPIGLAVELGKHLQLALEGRFIDGISIGGALQVRL